MILIRCTDDNERAADGVRSSLLLVAIASQPGAVVQCDTHGVALAREATRSRAYYIK